MSDPSPIVDVWSRTSRKYRVRATVLLIVDVVMFAILACFAYWLRSGEPFAPGMDGYGRELAQTFRVSADTDVALDKLLRYPIDQDDVPMQIVVHGLLLAAVVSIPILISILYRFPACLPFLLAIAFLAMMPWLALMLFISCVLASVWPRLRSRWASASLGMVPIILWIFGASRTSTQPVEALATPGEQIKYLAPWILAVVAGFLVIILCLLIAEKVNYRPGAIAPLLAVLLLAPALLFEFYVGRDELYYRLLEREFGPASHYLSFPDAQEEFERDVQASFAARPAPRPSLAGVREVRGLWWELRLSAWFHRQQAEAANACDVFIRNFPDSRYHLNALFIKATSLDTRLDPSAFATEKRPNFYDDFPSELSRKSWASIWVNAGQSPLRAVAGYRLAQLDARACDIESAVAGLREVLAQFSPKPAGDSGAPRPNGLLVPRPPEANLRIQVEPTVQAARRLLELLEHNRRDGLYGDAPLCGDEHSGDGLGLMAFDPRHANYAQNLAALEQRYPNMRLLDNVRVALADRRESPAERIAALEAAAAEFPEGDALPECLYRLGLAYQEAGRLDDARKALERARTARPESVWASQAGTRLRLLPPATLPAEPQNAP